MVKNGFKHPGMPTDKMPGLPPTGDLDGGIGRLSGGQNFLGPPQTNGSGLLSLKTGLGAPQPPSQALLGPPVGSGGPIEKNIFNGGGLPAIPPVPSTSPTGVMPPMGLKRVGMGIGGPKPPDLA